MKKIVSLIFIAIMSLALVGGGSFLLFGQDLFVPEIEQQVDGNEVTSQASGLWGSDTYSATSFAGGSGTSSSPYLISTAEQLSYMAKLINASTGSYNSAYYRLNANIDLSAHYWVPIGTSSYSFRGNFNGNGYVISGLTMNNFYHLRQTYQDGSFYEGEAYQGLFGYCSGATLTKIVLANINLTCPSAPSTLGSSGTNFITYCTGAVVAYAYSCIMTYCAVTSGTINLTISQANANPITGGLMGSGSLSGNAVYQCYAKISRLYVGSSSLTDGRTGGLIGNLTSSTSCAVNDCFFFGHIDSYAQYAGGIIGNCVNYSTSYLTTVQGGYFHDTGIAWLGKKYGGGVIGHTQNVTVKSYAVDVTTNLKLNAGGTNTACGGIVGADSGSGGEDIFQVAGGIRFQQFQQTL